MTDKFLAALFGLPAPDQMQIDNRSWPVEIQRRMRGAPPTDEEVHRTVHALCMKYLDQNVEAESIAESLLGNAICGLMHRHGIPEARRQVEDFVREYFDRAANDPDYESLR